MGGKSNAELLQIIAKTLGIEVEVFTVMQRDHPILRGDIKSFSPDRDILLPRMIQAFQALPDVPSCLQAVQYVEALSAAPVEAD